MQAGWRALAGSHPPPPASSPPTHTNARRHAQVVAGKDAMPPFKGTLSEREIRAVAAFVFDQAAGDKW